MSSRPYERGIKALQDLLPPLEDCPNCGSDVSAQPFEVRTNGARGLIALAAGSILAFFLLRRR